VGDATTLSGWHCNFNNRIISEGITMKIDANDVDRLIDEIDILEKDVRRYKHIWKKAQYNYEYMFDRHADKEIIIKQNEMLMNFMTDYALAQKALHKHNHNHCVKKVVDSIPDEELLIVSAAFEARLKDRCKDKPGQFESIMKALNLEESITG